jgi:hypothetical protein
MGREGGKWSAMEAWVGFLVFFVAWIALQSWILPRLGVPT